MKLYIDPGTGSMLFTILISVIGATVYWFRMLLIKIKTRSGKKEQISNQKIPFVIYAEEKRYWNVFEPICKELNNRGQDIVYLTSSKDDPAFNSSYKHLKVEFIGTGNKQFAKLNYLNAGVVLSTTPGLDVYQWKRSKEVDFYIHIPHMPNDLTLYRMFALDYYDAVLLSGKYQEDDIRQLEKLRNLPAKELVITGIPYMDKMSKRLTEYKKNSNQSYTVILAPSWGKSALLSVYGGRIIESLIKTGYHIIIRPHPQSFISEKELMDKLMNDYPNSDKLEWNNDRDNFDVLCKSDILISDFSGIIFEYALIHQKPVIYTDPNFDIGPYDAWWLNHPTWTLSALPRLGHQLADCDLPNIKTLIDSCIKDRKLSTNRKELINETWQYPKGGTTRVADYIMSKLTSYRKEG